MHRSRDCTRSTMQPASCACCLTTFHHRRCWSCGACLTDAYAVPLNPAGMCWQALQQLKTLQKVAAVAAGVSLLVAAGLAGGALAGSSASPQVIQEPQLAWLVHCSIALTGSNSSSQEAPESRSACLIHFVPLLWLWYNIMQGLIEDFALSKASMQVTEWPSARLQARPCYHKKSQYEIAWLQGTLLAFFGKTLHPLHAHIPGILLSRAASRG